MTGDDEDAFERVRDEMTVEAADRMFEPVPVAAIPFEVAEALTNLSAGDLRCVAHFLEVDAIRYDRLGLSITPPNPGSVRRDVATLLKALADLCDAR